ncbi:GPR endopeptidase [Calderihabitans maritimus]|uniref:Germination protease n=1 Tax=Calderihabitans maritimus TaxID=1246530 RepID=A0A1Z5HPW1_9FIRM|nr:GPR endopeptidase [Calderihabitans maritimus]GAW91407.1 germination protease [Calderihabitans maritimus]
MNKLHLYEKLGIQLDLALEAHELLRGATRREIPGVREEKETFEHASVTTVTILNEEGAQQMGRPPGSYITIEAPGIRHNNKAVHRSIAEILAQKLEFLMKELNIGTDASVLLVGLGNWDATPDALGPRVINHTMVTRHLYHYAPETVKGLRSVAALAPGVLGITGIETAEIVKGVVEKTKPDLIIAVDALAASNLERISTTIQLANTGINPGSGIGNRRAGINQETMGVPVIAIGVPTVVNATVFVFEAFARLFQKHPEVRQKVPDQTVQNITSNLLAPFEGKLTVTPKEIDDLIKNVSWIIASGLTMGLHPAIGPEEYAMYLQ